MLLENGIIGLFVSLTFGLSMIEANNSSSLLLKPLKIRIQQCRQGCLEKFAIKEAICHQRSECSMSGFPPYNYNSLPDALHLLCWDECAKPPPPKINKSILETWALRTVSMLHQDSLVLVDVAWTPLNTPNQCLVTWEVSGGGLMGNLLTESSSVQLSLWPETKYRVQVTCKNKRTGAMSRSLPLTINTDEEAVITPEQQLKQQQQLQQQQEQQELDHQDPSTTNDELHSINEQSTSITDQINTINEHQQTTLNNNKDYTTILKNHEEEINHNDLNLMTIAALSDMQKPLLFGVIAGTILIAIILSLYICIIRNQQSNNDKKALIDDDGNASTNGITNHYDHGFINDIYSPIDPFNCSRTVHVLNV